MVKIERFAVVLYATGAPTAKAHTIFQSCLRLHAGPLLPDIRCIVYERCRPLVYPRPLCIAHTSVAETKDHFSTPRPQLSLACHHTLNLVNQRLHPPGKDYSEGFGSSSSDDNPKGEPSQSSEDDHIFPLLRQDRFSLRFPAGVVGDYQL